MTGLFWATAVATAATADTVREQTAEYHPSHSNAAPSTPTTGRLDITTVILPSDSILTPPLRKKSDTTVNAKLSANCTQNYTFFGVAVYHPKHLSVNFWCKYIVVHSCYVSLATFDYLTCLSLISIAIYHSYLWLTMSLAAYFLWLLLFQMNAITYNIIM